ncbi:hypothetical protein CCACVL1_22173 [Corchorus capsularis]|uniref:F-box domain-containing protein n=1 Tax=Corchorus capsularis TaxID=210143 RepID=A0A1R3H0P6_COCAP|nr:hypothetical protein CCACVL1_22173 [Corchorus capsularis]
MDNSCRMRNGKSLKLGSQGNSGECGSRICSLPDTILLHILSFLPTKAAVKTSLLSKRWQFLWMSVTKLEFEEKSKEGATRINFMNFVERALLLHDLKNLQKFSLNCNLLSDGPRINAWISAVLKHKVKHLHLVLSYDDFDGWFVLPQHLFTCESLEKLFLVIYDCHQLPSFICLPNLKSLTLSSITFEDHHSVQRLLSGCPNLEKLRLSECVWVNVGAVYINSSKLEELNIYELEVEGYDPPGCQFIISGVRLKEFTYMGELKHDYCIIDTPSLVKVFVGGIVNRKEKGSDRLAAYHAHKILRGFGKTLEFLSLTCHVLQALTYADELAAHLPMFENLKQIEVFGLEAVDFACRGLLNIVQKSPHLESLHLLMGVRLSTISEEDDKVFNPVPACFLTHLKTVKLYKFNGTEEELRVVKSLLQRARVLEKLWLNSNEETRILGLLSTLPAGLLNNNVAFF